MPQTSNSYYHPLNLWLLWATNGYHGLAVCTFNVLRLSTTHMGITAQNMPPNFKFPIITNLIYGC